MAFRIVLQPQLTATHHTYWLGAFADGLKKHDVPFEIIDPCEMPDCDLLVMWGHHRMTHINKQTTHGKSYLVLERGYFLDRYEWTSIGFNGLNGYADFHNYNSPGNRWHRHRHLMQPWKDNEEGQIVVIGQWKSDATLRHVDIKSWYVKTLTTLENRFDSEIVFRAHPGHPGQREPKSRATLQQLLEDARCVVTFNSTVGVEAVMMGIPTIATDRGSMAWEVTGHSLDDIAAPVRYDREQWARDLAYTQWNHEEISTGVAWDHLRQRIGR